MHHFYLQGACKAALRTLLVLLAIIVKVEVVMVVVVVIQLQCVQARRFQQLIRKKTSKDTLWRVRHCISKTSSHIRETYNALHGFDAFCNS